MPHAQNLPAPSRERLLEAHRLAATFYRAQLQSPQAEGPRNYLVQRGVDHVLEPNSRWTIGYAPASWTALTQHLTAVGFTPTELTAAGLAVATRNGNLIDRFRDRVTFGIHDPDGDLIGFIGRAGPGARADVPKYLNSPHTTLYAKGEELFGLAEQARLFETGRRPAIVEGPLDVLAVDRLGTEVAAVSCCGTALTAAQVRALRAGTFGDSVVVAYDGDAAGRNAAAAAYLALAGAFPCTLSARPPGGEDPASLAVGNPVGLERLLTNPRPLADQLIDDVIEPWLPQRDNAEARVAALHHATRMAAGFLLDDARRQVARIGSQLDMPVAVVADDLLEQMGRISSTARHDAALFHSQAMRVGRPRQLGH